MALNSAHRAYAADGSMPPAQTRGVAQVNHGAYHYGLSQAGGYDSDDTTIAQGDVPRYFSINGAFAAPANMTGKFSYQTS